MAPMDDTDPLGRLGGTRRAYVLPDLKILYISLSKNACTSIKWLMAELAGEDLTGFVPGTSGFTRKEAVHLRHLWRETPKLNEVSTALRAEIHPDNGWFVFGVIRDPRVRMFSAWQNKYLLRSPHYAQWQSEPWSPRVPQKPQDVVDDFAVFVRTLAEDPGHPVFDDAHFYDQVRLLAEDSVPYTRIYDMAGLTVMQEDLAAHLRGVGHNGQFVLGRTNDTPLPANRLVFGDGVRELVEKIYSADFERFGDRWDFSRVDSREMDWDASSLQLVHSVIDGNERVTDLRQALAQVRADRRRAVITVRRLETRVERQRTRLRRLETARPRTLRSRIIPLVPSAVVRTLRRRHSGSPIGR